MRSMGTRLTQAWQPSDKDALYARSKYGMMPEQVAWMRDRFVDYFMSPDATRPVKKDWPRAWRTWVDTDHVQAKRVQFKTIAPSANDDAPLWRLRLEGFRVRKFWPAFAGPLPGEQGCFAPKDLLKEFGF